MSADGLTADQSLKGQSDYSGCLLFEEHVFILEKIMKKIICITLILVLVLLTAGCGLKNKAENVKIDLGESDIFSLEDRENAAACIVKKYKHDKCITQLNNVYYAGDKGSISEQQSREGLDDQAYDEIIAFMVSFHTSEKASAEGFSPDEDYTGYLHIFGRNNGGEWKFIDGGYPQVW